jgi:hypothetical protein
MANSLGNSVFNPAYWSREMQTVFHKENVAIALANTELRAILHDGDTAHRPYRTPPEVRTYTKGSDITVRDIRGTDEYLTVDTAQVVPFYVDDLDKIQNGYDVAAKFAGDAQRMLNNKLDQAVASQYSCADSDVYADDVGGSGSTTAVTLSTSNINQMFTAAGRMLDQLDIPQAPRFALIGPRQLETLRLYIAGKDTTVADVVGANGKVGNRFGFEIYYSNNLAFTATWTPANNPTAADTVSIGGVTWTWRATPSTAGEVDIGADTEASIALLVAAVNNAALYDQGDGAASGAGLGYYEVTDANRWLLTRLGIVATATTTTMTIVGYGDVVVACSETNDPWSVQTSHVLCGLKGATDLVAQKSANVEFRLAEKKLGRFVYPWHLYGIKTFDDGDAKLVDCNILASSWT